MPAPVPVTNLIPAVTVVRFRFEATVAAIGMVRVRIYARDGADGADPPWHYTGGVDLRATVWAALREILAAGGKGGKVDIREFDHVPRGPETMTGEPITDGSSSRVEPPPPGAAKVTGRLESPLYTAVERLKRHGTERRKVK